MRKFIDIISEGSKGEWRGSGPLYHGTDVLGLVSIIKSNRLTQSIDDRHPDNHGVSFTPNPIDAWGFADRSANIFDTNHNLTDLKLGRSPRKGAIIEVDSDKLRQHWKLVDYIDHNTFYGDEEGDENEVRCLGLVEPLDQFLVMVGCPLADIEWYVRFLETDYGREHWGDPAQIPALIEGLKALPHHPKFKAV